MLVRGPKTASQLRDHTPTLLLSIGNLANLTTQETSNFDPLARISTPTIMLFTVSKLFSEL